MRLSLLTTLFVLFTLTLAAPLEFNARATKPAVKTPSKAPAAGKKAPCKRSPGDVAEAIQHRGTRLGSGQEGDVYELTQKFKGQSAVVKVVTLSGFIREDMVKKEASHLMAVKQFLGWGEKKTDKGHIFYIIMKSMGLPHKAVESQLSAAAAQPLTGAAVARYKKEFGMENKDTNPSNFVFHKNGGKWEAEIIDWLKADRTNGQPLPTPPAPEQLADPSGCIQQ